MCSIFVHVYISGNLVLGHGSSNLLLLKAYVDIYMYKSSIFCVGLFSQLKISVTFDFEFLSDIQISHLFFSILDLYFPFFPYTYHFTQYRIILPFLRTHYSITFNIFCLFSLLYICFGFFSQSYNYPCFLFSFCCVLVYFLCTFFVLNFYALFSMRLNQSRLSHIVPCIVITYL